MTRNRARAADEVWAHIERDKRVDRFIRRVSIAAWSVTLIIVLVFSVMTAMQVAEMARGFAQGNLPFAVVVGSAIPLIVVLGFLSVLVATLSTIAIFLRLRTTSLAEIQLRLAALEDMLASEPDSGRPSDKG